VVKRGPAALKEALDIPRTRGFEELEVSIADGKHSLNKTPGGLAMSDRDAEQAGHCAWRVVSAVRERGVVQANHPPGGLRIRHGSP
jgi:hypothetical protein